MRQVLQNLRTGETQLAEVPCPALPSGHLLIRTTRTLVSAGTERMLVEFGKASMLEKARQQPDKVRMVLNKVKTDGLATTVAAVRNKLDQPLALGYCNVGRVMEVGEDVSGFEVGDRVISNGAHAEVVCAPVNLTAKVSGVVSDDEAAFTVLASIALQGVRLAQPTLGECVVVTGLGLIGLITVQLLRANGCRVLGVDFNGERCEMARRFGAEAVDLSTSADPVQAAHLFSRGNGVDAVIVAASTKSSEPIGQAAQMCRKRGRIVLVGLSGLKLSRADFYDKELSFQVSCSYGPGRYEDAYEKKGLDYPIGFVRWTEQRNFEAILDMLSDRRLDFTSMISHRFAIEEADRAYQVVAGGEPSLGILLSYPEAADLPDEKIRDRTVTRRAASSVAAVRGTKHPPRVAVIGSGNYATAVLVPALKATGARMGTIASSGGVSGAHAAQKFDFEKTTTDLDAIFNDETVDAVVIATHHDSHARFAIRALEAGKHVFVEKPLALTHEEIDAIVAARAAAAEKGTAPRVMVGFNRRFAPHVVKLRQLLAGSASPKSMIMTVNAGAIPTNHWTQDPLVGGGRIIGEGCHFIDLLRHLAGAPIESHSAKFLQTEAQDTATISLRFVDGSIGTIHYFANGHKSFPKERLEVFTQGRMIQLDNFLKLAGLGYDKFDKMSLWKQDKGQQACASAFVESVAKDGPDPIPFDELIEVARATIEIARSSS